MTIFFKENNNFLSEKNIEFIENIPEKIPFFLQETAAYTKTGQSKKDSFFSHIIMNRIDSDLSFQELINSVFYTDTIDILNNFCKSINEKPYFYTRICYNITFNNGFDLSEIHQDHNFNHKVIIIYLNECDKNSKTCILKDEKIIKESYPKKFKGICFENLPHYIHFPKSGYRLALVATYI